MTENESGSKALESGFFFFLIPTPNPKPENDQKAGEQKMRARSPNTILAFSPVKASKGQWQRETQVVVVARSSRGCDCASWYGLPLFLMISSMGKAKSSVRTTKRKSYFPPAPLFTYSLYEWHIHVKGQEKEISYVLLKLKQISIEQEWNIIFDTVKWS